MKKVVKSIMHYYVDIVHNLVKAHKADEIKYYETKLLAAVFSPMILLAGLSNLLFGFLMNISFLKTIIFLFIFILCSFSILWVMKTNLTNNIKTHFMSICFLIAIFTTYQIYYQKIYIIFWFILVVITILSSFNSNKTILLYVFLAYIILYIVAYIQYPHFIIRSNNINNSILFLMLLFINITSLIVNYVYTSIGDKKNDQFLEIDKKSQEIMMLYDKLLEREEILKTQNEKLNDYNNQLEINRERLEYLADKDPLTGLPNRKMISEQLQLLINLKADQNQTFGIAMIDIDDFKKINDSMGHSFGDSLLLEAIERIQAKAGENDMLGRIGGDELILLMRNSISGEDIYAYMQSICELFDHSFHIASIQTKITISIGIAIWPDDGKTTDDILKACETAMYKAKDSGKNHFYFYHPKMKQEIMQKIELEQHFIEALEKEYFSVVYQPLFSTKTKEIISFEALLRLETKEYGKISPVEFIPFAEENGFICELGAWVIKKVCIKIKELESKFHTNVKVAVNVSPIQIYTEDFVESVKKILTKYDVKPSSMEFEITESIFLRQKDVAFHVIHELREYGISIAMDDFGTGYSSLSYLLELPIDKLKIDRSFINTISKDDSKTYGKNNLVGCIIDMAHHLNLSVVAEGIETQEQLEYLERHDCDLLQGFLLSKPVEDIPLNNLFL